ncbi:bidirectional sugar transporter SWEET16-like isoform X2 [Rhododendron vialii]|uniref:bidirectional sugar transporter SWEET16-like isoform X2 n=1 Tax=Rhododendron vialii TaxID=182163 RepID=UPI00265E0A57|nr:bidirectional sugar transporter SWEET16-like isoform X2 [Rhododendron vialii]
MASLSFIIGLVGNIISLLVFASPIGTFMRVVKKKSTENYKAIPYITTLLSTSLWTFYGLLKPGGLLIVTVNAAGAVLQFVYVTLFLIYAPKNIKVKSMKLVGIFDVFFLGTVIGVALGAIHGSLRLTIVGIICAVLTIGMYAAPLSSMRMVVKTKSVEYMPFLLSFFLFLNAGVWSVYALLVKDYYVGVPNAIGFVLGSAQLILYTIYKNKSPSPSSTKSNEEREEEGSTNLIKNAIEMQQGHDKDDPKSINRSLHKGSSLPKSSISRQYTVNKLAKTRSLCNPYELRYGPDHDYDVENGRSSAQ